MYRITTTNNNIKAGNDVNILSDEQFEKEAITINKKLDVVINIIANENANIEVKLSVNDTRYHYIGDIVEEAKSAPLTSLDFINCF